MRKSRKDGIGYHGNSEGSSISQGLGLKKTFCKEKVIERHLHHSRWLPYIPAIPRQHIPGIDCNKPLCAPVIHSRAGIVRGIGNEHLGTRRYRHVEIDSRRE